MRKPEPCTLEIARVRLEPMTPEHADALGAAARDGELWHLHVTSVPAPHEAGAYIAAAMQGYADGHMLPFVVRDLADGTVVGSTRYHDIVPEVERLEIGYTSS
jgi:RimJ/RimL family protein N-acetyltransferase